MIEEVRLKRLAHVRANLAQLAAPDKPHEFVPFGIRAAFGSRLRVRYRISICPVGGPLE
jgi:hypothetical protein